MLKQAVFLILCALLVSGCANVGPRELSACLADKQIMGAYNDFQSKNHGNFLYRGRSYLTGGLDRQTGRVTCYWQVHSLAADIIPGSDPIGQCYRDGSTDCTILMDGPKMIFEPSGKPQTGATATLATPQMRGQIQTPASSNGTEVILKLIGAFAQGVAIGLHSYSGTSYSYPPPAAYQGRSSSVDDPPILGLGMGLCSGPGLNLGLGVTGGSKQTPSCRGE